MPKITFIENDNTGARYLGEDIIVYVPGQEELVDANNLDKIDNNNCILLTSLSSIDKEDYLKTNSFVYNILNNNLQVLYHYIPTPIPDTLDLNFLKDKNSYDIKFITLGKLTDEFLKFDGTTITKSDLLDSLQSVAVERQDCTIITTALITDSSISTFKQALDTDLSKKEGPYVLNKSTLKYIGLFASNELNYTVSDLAATVKDPSLAYLIQYSKANNQGKKWDAVAGVNRGVVNNIYSGSTISKYELDKNIMTDAGSSFNAVCEVRPYGNVLWGDRTLYINNGGEGLKASSFLSIRNLVCDIVKRCYYSAINNTYETNNEITWSNFKASITELLDQMVSSYNIADYKIIKKPTKKRATIECAIHLTPLEPVEDFEIYIELNNVETNIDDRLE